MKRTYIVLGALFSTLSCSSSPSPPTSDVGQDGKTTESDAGDLGTTRDVGQTERTDEEKAILGIDERRAWTLPTLEREVHVVYVESNIPHIYAHSREDLGRVMGFVVASDRFFTMDLQRRLALGTLSELLGDLGLSNDFESRLTGMPDVTERVFAGFDEADGRFIDAYVEGINAYIEAVRAGDIAPPSELKLAGPILGSRDPADLMKPFDRRDIAALVAVIMYQTTFESDDVDRQAKAQVHDDLFAGAPKESLRKAGLRQDIVERLEPLFPVTSTGGWAIEDPEGLRVRSLGSSRSLSGSSSGVPRRLQVSETLLLRGRERLGQWAKRLGKSDENNFGSNTWAVSSKGTPDGSALVAGDGHLPLYVPSIMYQIGLNTKVFGDGDIHQTGLLITSLPTLAVGTNGKVAWSQVNPVADITDWYLEELILDDQGMPKATVFEGQERALVSIDETYSVADLPALQSVGREEVRRRFTTFDGRLVFDIEGRVLLEDEVPSAGEVVIQLGAKEVVPEDMDLDGKIDAISFDYAAFDTTSYVKTIGDLGRSQNVAEFHESTKAMVGNLLYSTVADHEGRVLFTSYQGVPCRGYLARDADRRWADGADPTRLLDGTQYRGFTVPTLPDGRVDESLGQTDPYACVVPFEETPQALNPTAGFVFNANNQPAPIHNDGTLFDDPWYIGGPWSSVRADTISTTLADLVDRKAATVETMAALQANTTSRLGELFWPYLRQALESARLLGDTEGRVLSPEEVRLAALFAMRSDAFNDVASRLSEWGARGYRTPSGVSTFYQTVDDDDRADAVATMIFNAWLPRVVQGVFQDEEMESAWLFKASRMKLTALRRFLDSRGETNPMNLASFDSDTGESAFFDDVGTAAVVERSDEVLLGALFGALTFLESPEIGPGEGGFGNPDRSTWLWGLRHQVQLRTTLADFLPEGSSFSLLLGGFSINTSKLPLVDGLTDGDPRKDLVWFPRDGDNFAVDASSPGFSGTSFHYRHGPAMRMVIGLRDGEVWGQNIVPGGQSSLNDSPFFADQAREWLANETVPLRFYVDQVIEGADRREVFRPQSAD
jgi:penicillin G amidase